MNYSNLHPAEQLAATMKMIYDRGLTSSKGGNLSIKDENGDIWITPAGIDKQNLTAADIMQVKPDGTVIGKHTPSVELPFHKLIYDAGSDIHAVLHAHAPALVMFSLMRKAPDTRIIADCEEVCGLLGIATYGCPGSNELGNNLKNAFMTGARSVIMENHGVCVAGSDLKDIFGKFEACEQTCHIYEQAKRIGDAKILTDEQIDEYNASYLKTALESFECGSPTNSERSAISAVYETSKRAYTRKVFFSGLGAISQRAGDDAFVITPEDKVIPLMDRDDIVIVRNGKSEAGKKASHFANLHKAIYDAHPEIGSIMTAQSPCLMAFAATNKHMNSLLIPETFILLHDIPNVSFEDSVKSPDKINELIGEIHPLVIMDNIGATIVGKDAFDAFVSYEVAEDSAYGITESSALGTIELISGKDVDDLVSFFDIKL